MGISVNFLPIGRFSLDKKSLGDYERAYRGFSLDNFRELVELQRKRL